MNENEINLYGALYLCKAKKGIREIRLHKIICLSKLQPLKLKYPFTFTFDQQFSFDLNSLLNQLINDGIIKYRISNEIKYYQLTIHGKNVLRAFKEVKEYKNKLDAIYFKYKYHNTRPIVNLIREFKEEQL